MSLIITEIVADIIVKIALCGLDVFVLLARTHPKFARILRNPVVQNLAKAAFARQHTFVQAFSPTLTVVADRLPNGVLHGFVRLYRGETPVVISQFSNNHRHGTELRFSDDGKLLNETTYYKGNRRGVEKRYVGDKVFDLILWNDNDTMKSRKKTNPVDGKVKETRFVNGHPREIVVSRDGKIETITRYRKEDAIGGSNNGWSKHNRAPLGIREAKRDNLNPATHMIYYLNRPIVDGTRSIRVEDLKLHGKQVKFINGKLTRTAVYRDGKLHGEYRSHFPSGSPSQETSYAHGFKHGKSTTYHANGTVASECLYENDCVDGEHRSYYDTGAVECVKQHDKYGRLHGNTTKYNPDGSISSVLQYDDCKLVKTTDYGSDGSVARVTHYRRGEIDGLRIEYQPDGFESAVETYADGFIYTRREFDRERGLVAGQDWGVVGGEYKIVAQWTVEDGEKVYSLGGPGK